MNVTLAIVSFNAKYALAVALESYRKQNPDYPARFFCWDNGSRDGAKEYAEANADLMLHGDNSRSHGECLTELIRRVETEYVLVSDNDILWTKPGGVRYMIGLLSADTWVVCPDRPGVARFSVAGYSPNIIVGLFRTETAQRICKELDLGHRRDPWIETGGIAWLAARTHGLDAVESPGVWNYVHHYRNMSRLWEHAPNYPYLEGIQSEPERWGLSEYEARYNRIKRDLAKIRGS